MIMAHWDSLNQKKPDRQCISPEWVLFYRKQFQLPDVELDMKPLWARQSTGTD
jgi:hypothetical protein